MINTIPRGLEVGVGGGDDGGGSEGEGMGVGVGEEMVGEGSVEARIHCLDPGREVGVGGVALLEVVDGAGGIGEVGVGEGEVGVEDGGKIVGVEASALPKECLHLGVGEEGGEDGVAVGEEEVWVGVGSEGRVGGEEGVGVAEEEGGGKSGEENVGVGVEFGGLDVGVGGPLGAEVVRVGGVQGENGEDGVGGVVGGVRATPCTSPPPFPWHRVKWDMNNI